MSKNKQRFWDLALALLLAAMLTGFTATEPATAGDRLRPYTPTAFTRPISAAAQVIPAVHIQRLTATTSSL
jgi:hypothetical protein